ncbi:TIGR02996 domain-containing protein [Gemmata sp. G18]|uniref:TIGR02996 domain-containing protein n=1 Tax=Gemmata palustris TaxID=2822762 RepID=A0ABS5BYU6_9BACT|nr:TIGR02996 domain-containing protein [Gemmata palustris]MBP3958853.1 TIGR02996 domain-containing protein [Gemmata palustris]
MNDRDALLAAILAQPDEDTPRLIYADWLDENGEPDRAEFIRLQCRLPHLSRRTAEAKRLIARETELRAQLFKHLDKLPFTKISYRRGFVDSITSGLQLFAKYAPELRTEDTPAFELILESDEEDDEQMEVADYGRESLILPIVKRHELRRCISLDSQFYLHGETAIALFSSRNLTALRRLRATGDASDAFEELGASTFANLRWLNLHNNDDLDHHPPEIRQIVCSKYLVNLEHLDLGDCNLDDECLKSLTTTQHLKRLHYLDISGSKFRSGLPNFFRSDSLPALTELDLSDPQYWFWPVPEINEYVKLLADTPRIERLTKLALRRSKLTDEGAIALAMSPRKLQLTRLDLWGNQISATAKQALENRFGRGVCTYRQPGDRNRR